MTNKIKTFNFDMDGVLTNFEKSVNMICGCTAKELDAKGAMKKALFLNEFKANGLFLNFLPMNDLPQMVEFMFELREQGYEVNVLSSAGNEHFEKCKADKIQWLENNISFKFDNVRIVKKSIDKAEFANSESVLIDDRNKALEPFAKKGGFVIKHSSFDNTFRKYNKLINWLAKY